MTLHFIEWHATSLKKSRLRRRLSNENKSYSTNQVTVSKASCHGANITVGTVGKKATGGQKFSISSRQLPPGVLFVC